MADAPSLSLSFPHPDVALLAFDTPGKGANVLSRSTLSELAAQLDVLERHSGLAGVVVSSRKPGVFIAGADLREFAAAGNPTREEVVALAAGGRKLFARLSRLPCVTVAAIDGACLGGGAELAMWCDRRLMTTNPKCQFGLPEVKLGMFPGWGGTVRLPRLVGLGNAVELICGGESIDGKSALAMGLASDVVPSERLEEAAVALVRAEQQSQAYLQDRQRWQQPLAVSETELAFLAATAAAYIQGQTKGQYPAPLAALDLMVSSAMLDAEEAGERESAGFAELFGTPVNRALINVFFLQDRNKKDPGVAGEVRPRSVQRVGIIGAGIMGSGIAAAVIKRETPAVVFDVSPAALANGVAKALEEAAYDRSLRGPDPQRLVKLVPRLQAAAREADVAAADLVIEAVVENPQVKQELFARLEPLLGEDAVLASNTSAISISRLAAGLKRPDRFCGLHFFNPVRRMPLVEVIRGVHTSDQTVATAVAFAKALGKSPIVVRDGPGFLVNRLLFPYMNEALELVLEGAPLDTVDRAATEFGMPMGPITLFDVVGLDTALYAGRVMHEAFPDRVVQSPLLAALVERGRLGQKSGAGFFSYARRKDRGEPDPQVAELIETLRRDRREIPPQELQDRLFLPMLLEATRVLAEELVRDARDVDLGLIYGIGFPPFRGGLLFWADTLGASGILQRLAPYQHLGERFQPTPLLTETARSGGRFYP
jgi:3-hydroxyacyl-CoA dehydrogenase/enoyl-CoA hydratase/3-hydroxybutyryl-CoA epimerase/3-hydroxyacyl-CoA dehydrogenase/enoyl-CoA hydratase/3-hydroxybutyryl-CoA epimerase/enoyl-CoA isomerase